MAKNIYMYMQERPRGFDQKQFTQRKDYTK